MTRFQNWALIAALVFATVCHAQVAARAGTNPNLPPTRTITGMVYDPSGAPAPGVEMSVMPRSGLVQNLKSDAGGKFTLSWQPLNLGFGAAAAGAAPTIEYLLLGRDFEHNFAAAASIDEKATNKDLHLKAGLALSGSVQDNNGAAVNTATVRLMMTTLSSSSVMGGQPATVDEQGVFTFSALPQGRGYSLTVTAPGFASTNVPAVASGMQTASLKLPPIKLRPMNKRLEGWVVGPDDKPVPGATVMVSGAGQTASSARTDANGHFALKVSEGTFRVTATVPNNPNNINGQLRSSSVQAQSGDLDVVLKLGVPGPAPRGNNPAPPNNPPLIGPL